MREQDLEVEILRKKEKMDKENIDKAFLKEYDNQFGFWGYFDKPKSHQELEE